MYFMKLLKNQAEVWGGENQPNTFVQRIMTSFKYMNVFILQLIHLLWSNIKKWSSRHLLHYAPPTLFLSPLPLFFFFLILWGDYLLPFLHMILMKLSFTVYSNWPDYFNHLQSQFYNHHPLSPPPVIHLWKGRHLTQGDIRDFLTGWCLLCGVQKWGDRKSQGLGQIGPSSFKLLNPAKPESLGFTSHVTWFPFNFDYPSHKPKSSDCKSLLKFLF